MLIERVAKEIRMEEIPIQTFFTRVDKEERKSMKNHHGLPQNMPRATFTRVIHTKVQETSRKVKNSAKRNLVKTAAASTAIGVAAAVKIATGDTDVLQSLTNAALNFYDLATGAAVFSNFETLTMGTKTAVAAGVLAGTAAAAFKKAQPKVHFTKLSQPKQHILQKDLGHQTAYVSKQWFEEHRADLAKAGNKVKIRTAKGQEYIAFAQPLHDLAYDQ